MNRDNIAEASTEAGALVTLGATFAPVHKNPHPGGRDYVLLPKPDGVVVEYLERPEHPQRLGGTVKINDTESFIAATNRYADKNRSVLYAALHPAAFTAVLNDHSDKRLSQSGHDGANWRDHRVSFVLANAKECKVWHECQKKEMTQESFAYFIEDNLPDFKSPEGGKMLEIALNFRVKQGVAFKSAIRLQDSQVQLEYTEQNEAGAGSAGKMSIPETFTIEIPVFDGLEAKKYRFEARLRYKLGGGSLALRYELIRPHKVIEQAFKDVLEQVKKGVKDVPVIFGTPE